MPAHNENFPWMSYYGNYNFFASRMKEHHKVSEIRKVNECVYEIVRGNKDLIKVFACECYIFGLAELYETQQNIEALNAIVINGNWCSYTDEAKLHGRREKIGIFNIAGFMASIQMQDFWNYLTTEERKLYEAKGLL